MNWLIIKSAAQISASVSSQAEAVILNNGDDSCTVINDDESLDDAMMKKYYDLFFKITHALIIDETFAVHESRDDHQIMMQNILLGLLLGRNIPIFSLSKACLFVRKYFVRSFNSDEEMASSLQDAYKTLQQSEMRDESLKELMSRGIPFTPDSFASYIKKDRLDICRIFYYAGMDVNSRDSEGTSMLNVAVRGDVPDVVAWLLRKRVNINSVSKDRGYTAVMDAVWKNNLEVAAMLVDKGADLSFVSKEGQSILVLAVGIGSPDMCKLLAEHGADPDIKDSMGMSAFEYASLFKKMDIVDALLPFHRERV